MKMKEEMEAVEQVNAEPEIKRFPMDHDSLDAVSGGVKVLKDDEKVSPPSDGRH